MRHDADADLRERFSELREHDRSAMPVFDKVALQASTRGLQIRPVLAWTAGGFALAAAVGLFPLLRAPTTELDAAAVAMPAWQSQTDFLLANAGDSLQRLSWTSSPTSGLGHLTFNHYLEDL